MISVDIWQGIDRLAFHENVILLDVKLRSQAKLWLLLDFASRVLGAVGALLDRDDV
jgi:hypothetical protein